MRSSICYIYLARTSSLQGSIKSSNDRTVRLWDIQSGASAVVSFQSEGIPVSFAVNKVTEDVVVGTDEGELFRLFVN